MARPKRKQELNGRNLLSRDQLMQVAEDDAQRMLGVSAEEAWRLIDNRDPKVVGTIAETELKGLRWLLQND
ncbi:MAG: hypothetical protein IT384_00455 [Deltaproteobacteria bacterium]|nr:hypothetical protein [Deltaproteobacteria bacterium]